MVSLAIPMSGAPAARYAPLLQREDGAPQPSSKLVEGLEAPLPKPEPMDAEGPVIQGMHCKDTCATQIWPCDIYRLLPLCNICPHHRLLCNPTFKAWVAACCGLPSCRDTVGCWQTLSCGSILACIMQQPSSCFLDRYWCCLIRFICASAQAPAMN